MSFRLIIILSTCLAIVSCAAPPATVDANGLKTELLIVNESPESAVTIATFDESVDCNGQHLLTFGTKNFREHTVTMPERNFQTINYQYLGVANTGAGLVSRTCSAIYSFATKAKEKYRITINNSTDECRIVVDRPKDTTSDQKVTVELFKRVLSRPLFSSSGPWCKADQRFKPLMP